jgi:hypothetical protein
MEDIHVQSSCSDVVQLQIKRSQRTCLILFLLSFVGLISFGQGPLSLNYGDAGVSVRFSLLPSVSWIVAIYAVVFFLKRRKVITLVPTIVRKLGYLGSLILVGNVLYSTLLYTILLLGFTQSQGTTATGGRIALGQSGSETWVIDGIEYKINSTYFLIFNDRCQYTIEYEYPSATSIHDKTEALKVAFPIMAHAYTNRLYDRFVGKTGDKEIKPSRIGVALFKREGIKSSGYRVALTLSEIDLRLEESTRQPGSDDI